MKNLTAAKIDYLAAAAGAIAADAVYEYYGDNYFVDEKIVYQKVTAAYDAAYFAKTAELMA